MTRRARGPHYSFRVDFQRVGRHRDVPPLTVVAPGPNDDGMIPELDAAIHAYAGRFLFSPDYMISWYGADGPQITTDGGTATGRIDGGRSGTFTIVGLGTARQETA